MWYMGQSGQGWKIGYAESVNGTNNWETLSSPIITPIQSVNWDKTEKEVGHPCVLHVPGKNYEMWYVVVSPIWQSGPDRFRLRYATSENGINWNIHQNYVMTGTSNFWDSGGINRGVSVIYDNGLYKMWYTGVDNWNNWKIGYATSINGINWQKNSSPVILPTKTWELTFLSYPFVRKSGDKYEMWYAATQNDTATSIVYATSTDGINWNDKPSNKNPVITISSGFDSNFVITPWITTENNINRLWYSGYNGRWSIGYAEEIPPEKIVLLPGLGASWNHENIVLGIDRPNSEWYATPFVHTYDGFIQTLKNLDYRDSGGEQNLFIYYYNWTKPLDQLAGDFKSYLENTVKPASGEKINLVGHSLGGLVARTYAHKYSPIFINKIITVGSPHQGSAKTYYLWGGGDLAKAVSGWQAVALGLLLNIRQPYYTTKADAVRNVAPIIKDLLPTGDYLKQNSQILSTASLPLQNTYLSALNLLSDLNNLNALVGKISNSTLRFIEITPQEWYNKILERWPNGTPTGQNEEFDWGDTTVLSSSARYGRNIFELADLKHGELIEKEAGQKKILEILGLSTGNVAIIPTEDFANTLIFQLASPATLTVVDPNGQEITGNKLLVIPHAANGDYSVKVTGTADGSYTLYAGQIKDQQESWLNLSAATAANQQDTYTLSVPDQVQLALTDNLAVIDQNDAKTKINQLKDYLASANLPASTRRSTLASLNTILRAYDRRQYESAILALYQLRVRLTDRAVKNKILDIITPLENVYVRSRTGSYSTAKLTKEKALAQKYFDQLENKLKSSSKANKDHAWLWEKTKEKLQTADTQSNYAAHIRYTGVQYLSQEGLRLLK
ncbi:MAG: alpha/beta fold hydrolase [Candidatus Shapirobacteria bacterium]